MRPALAQLAPGLLIALGGISCSEYCAASHCGPLPPLGPPSGSPDTSFGRPGTFVMDPSPRSDVAAALTGDGASLFIAGSDEVPGAGDSEWRLEKRNASDGIKVESFGIAGVVTSNPGTGADSVTAATVDGATPSFVFLAGYDSSPGNRQWRIEKRRISDGSLDPTFGTGGTVTSNPSAGRDEPVAILHDGGDLYGVGFDESPGSGDTRWRIEKRAGTTGALVAAFATNGVYTINPSTGTDAPRAIAADPAGGFLFVAGYDT